MKKCIILFTVALTICMQAIAGWEITYRVTETDGSISYDVMLIEDNTVKYGGIDESFIFNTKSNQFSFIINQNKTFWSGNILELRNEMSDAIKSVMNEMIDSLPEEQREIYVKMLESITQMYDSPASDKINSINIKITNTGIQEEIAGYTSHKYDVNVGGNLVESIWISSELDLKEELNPQKIAEMLNQIMPNVDGELYYEFTNQYLELWKKGFRMKSTDDEGDTIEVIKVSQRNITGNELGVPEGYTKISPLEFIQNQMTGGDSNNNEEW